MEQNKKIEDASIVELKAAVYDRLVAIEGLQKEIQAINAELIKRQQPPITKNDNIQEQKGGAKK